MSRLPDGREHIAMLRTATDLPSGGRAHLWVGDHWCVIALDAPPLIVVPPWVWTLPQAAAFADALAEAAVCG